MKNKIKYLAGSIAVGGLLTATVMAANLSDPHYLQPLAASKQPKLLEKFSSARHLESGYTISHTRPNDFPPGFPSSQEQGNDFKYAEKEQEGIHYYYYKAFTPDGLPMYGHEIVYKNLSFEVNHTVGVTNMDGYCSVGRKYNMLEEEMGPFAKDCEGRG